MVQGVWWWNGRRITDQLHALFATTSCLANHWPIDQLSIWGSHGQQPLKDCL